MIFLKINYPKVYRKWKKEYGLKAKPKKKKK